MTRLSRFCSTHKHTHTEQHAHTQGRRGALEIPLMTACDRTWCPRFTLHPPHHYCIDYLGWLIIYTYSISSREATHTHAPYCLRVDGDCIVVYPPSLFILLADLCLVMSSVPLWTWSQAVEKKRNTISPFRLAENRMHDIGFL